MATVKEIKRKKGRAFQIGFSFRGRRVWLSLGNQYTRADAQEIARNVDAITAAITSGRPLDRRVENWLSSIPEDLKARLENVDLVERRRVGTLAELFDEYFDSEGSTFKPTTLRNKRQSTRSLLKYAGETTLLSDFGRRSASAFVASLERANFADATRAGIIKDLRRVWNWAIESEILDDNPFKNVRSGSYRNKSREYYVSIDDYRRILDACPCREWRVLIALYRIGGLRCSEAFYLRWSDVDFPGGRLLVHSPKTEKHGKDSRVVPLFPELKEELEKLWDEIPEGGPAEIIATISRTSVWKCLQRIVFSAGLNTWDRLVQNLRSSRAIEISRAFGTLAESVWIGHSPQTAINHYLHLLDEDYKRAAETTVEKIDHKNDHTKTRFFDEKTTF